MRNIHRFLPWVIAAVCVAFLYYGIEIYSAEFPVKYSDDQTVWGAFGDYINMLLNVINIVILSLIGMITYQTTHAFNRLQITPLLDFSVDSPSKFEDHISDSWYLINCSNASARNIRIKFFIGELFESRWIACYSLNGNSRLELPWLRFATAISVIYCDTLEENFYQLDYQNLRGAPRTINRARYEAIVSSTLRANYIDLVDNYNNHVKINLNNNGHNGILDGADFVETFLNHHNFNQPPS